MKNFKTLSSRKTDCIKKQVDSLINSSNTNVVQFKTNTGHELTIHKSEAFMLVRNFMIEKLSLQNATNNQILGISINVVFSVYSYHRKLNKLMHKIPLYNYTGTKQMREFIYARPLTKNEDCRIYNPDDLVKPRINDELKEKFDILFKVYSFKNVPEATINLMLTATSILQAEVDDRFYVIPQKSFYELAFKK